MVVKLVDGSLGCIWVVVVVRFGGLRGLILFVWVNDF